MRKARSARLPSKSPRLPPPAKRWFALAVGNQHRAHVGIPGKEVGDELLFVGPRIGEDHAEVVNRQTAFLVRRPLVGGEP